MRDSLSDKIGPCSTVILDPLPHLVMRTPIAKVASDGNSGAVQWILHSDGNGLGSDAMWRMKLETGTKCNADNATKPNYTSPKRVEYAAVMSNSCSLALYAP